MRYTVFPLYGINPATEEEEATCQCSDPDCNRVGKHPSVLWSKLVAGEQIRAPRSCGHGIVTGQKSGIFVVDTDGWEADEALREAYEMPDTFTVATPSGGRHYYFKWPGFFVKNSVGQLLPNVDIRGDGGFVVAPGSPHKSGTSYRTEYDDPVIADAPEWLIRWPGLKGRAPSEGSDNAPFPVDVTTDVGKKRVELGKAACLEMPAVADDSAGTPLLRVAIRLVRTLELPLDVAHELIANIYNPRCVKADGVTPYPWSDKEIDHKLLDARDKSTVPCGDVSPFDLNEALKPKKVHIAGATYECDLKSVCTVVPAATTFGNVCSILSGNIESWDGVLAYDAFRDRIVALPPKAGGPRPIKLEAEKTCFVDRDVSSIRKWFECVGGLKVSKENAWDAAISVARDNAFHPVKDYLDSLPAPETGMLHRAAELFFGTKDPLDSVLVSKFMIGAVRRILNPGEKMDTMLVLVGHQGAGKSTFVPALFGKEFTSEDLADIKSKDAMIGLAGKWAIEVAELDKMLRTDPETVKAFVSRCVDPYRAPYERVSTDHPRQCVYVGTTNRDDFLRDPTGERRYWIVDVRKTGGVNLPVVRALRDTMWADAYRLAKLDKDETPHWLTEVEARTLATRCSIFKGEDGWGAVVAEYCTGRTTVRTLDIYKYLGGTTEKVEGRHEKRITDILRELGCVRIVSAVGSQRIRAWAVPDALSAAKVPEKEVARREGAAILEGII